MKKRGGKATAPSSGSVRRKLIWPAVLAVAIAATVAALYFAFPRTAKARHVVLVSVDTLRADHLSCYGYTEHRTPHIDALAAKGVLFENAATSTPLTFPAHATLLTGRTPPRHGILDNFGFRLEDKEETLAETLHAAGFATGGFVGAFVLDSRWGLGQGFDTYFDQFDPQPGQQLTALESNQRTGDKVLEPALEWIRAHRDRSSFTFIHFYDPHTPYAPPEPYRKTFGPTERGYYDGEIAFIDDLIGRLRASLEEEGLWQETLFILLADHGEALGEHGEATHGYFIYDATIRIPLIVKAPGTSRGQRVAAQVRTIDVAPTILDWLNVKTPGGMEGVSLKPLLEKPESNPNLVAYVESHYPELHFGWAPLRGLRTDRYKLIDAPERELYDLREDPKESTNVIGARPGVADQLSSSLERYAALSPSPAARPQAADRETEERLRALGYLTSRAERPKSAAGARLADPKAKIDVFNKVNEARIAGQIGEVDRAVTLLEETLRDDPEVMLAYMLLGNIRLQQKAFVKAEAVFKRALARNDASESASLGLALAYKGQGRLAEAAVGFERSLSGADRARAAFQLAEVRLAQGRAADAERLLNDQLQSEPDTSLRLTLADALLAQGKHAQALSELRKAQAEDPQNALVHLSLGNLLLDRGDVGAALGAYARAEALAPEDARVWNAKGNALARKGDAPGALAAFQKSVELETSFAPAQNNLGIALAQTGRGSDAERAFKKAIQSDPAYAQAYNNLGFLYLRAGATREAVPLFRRALELKPDYDQARENLSAALKAPVGAGSPR